MERLLGTAKDMWGHNGILEVFIRDSIGDCFNKKQLSKILTMGYQHGPLPGFLVLA